MPSRRLLLAVLSLAALAPRAAAADNTVPGYINHIPPETAEERDARHRRVAERRANPPLVLVHRGAHKFAPENTLEAYAAAMDHGADGCEIDPHRSKDGVVYLFHDGTADRMLDGSGPMKEKTYYEIAGMKFKKRYGTATEDTRVPTFAAFLVLARQRTMLIHLDLKEPGVQDDIITMLDEADMWDHVAEINAGHADKLVAHPKAKRLRYKGSFPTDGRGVVNFLKTPGELIFTDADPTPATVTLGREKTDPVPLPDGLRVRWGPQGPVEEGNRKEK